MRIANSRSREMKKSVPATIVAIAQAKLASEKREKQPAKVCAMAASYADLGKQFIPLAAKSYVDGRVDKRLDVVRINGAATDPSLCVAGQTWPRLETPGIANTSG